jgi:small basic protein (TIGR04137 family)
MSRHPSYGKASKSEQKRNVFKRFERIDVLRKLGKWKDSENKKVTGLPKTPTNLES